MCYLNKSGNIWNAQHMETWYLHQGLKAILFCCKEQGSNSLKTIKNQGGSFPWQAPSCLGEAAAERIHQPLLFTFLCFQNKSLPKTPCCTSPLNLQNPLPQALECNSFYQSTLSLQPAVYLQKPMALLWSANEEKGPRAQAHRENRMGEFFERNYLITLHRTAAHSPFKK